MVFLFAPFIKSIYHEYLDCWVADIYMFVAASTKNTISMETLWYAPKYLRVLNKWCLVWASHAPDVH